MLFNKTIQAFAFGLALLAASFTATADEANLSTKVSESSTYVDFNLLKVSKSGLDLTGIGFTVGKDLNDYFATEAFVGVGRSYDMVNEVIDRGLIVPLKVELNRYAGFNIKPNINITERINLFATAGYVYSKIDMSWADYKASASDWDTSFSVGVEFKGFSGGKGSLSYVDVGAYDGLQLSLGFYL